MYIQDKAVFKAVKFAQRMLYGNKDFNGADKACRIAADYWKADLHETQKYVRRWLWEKITEKAMGNDGYYTMYCPHDRYMMDDPGGRDYCLICPDCGYKRLYNVNSFDVDRAFVSPCPKCGYVDCTQRSVIRHDLYRWLVDNGIIPD